MDEEDTLKQQIAAMTARKEEVENMLSDAEQTIMKQSEATKEERRASEEQTNQLASQVQNLSWGCFVSKFASATSLLIGFLSKYCRYTSGAQTERGASCALFTSSRAGGGSRTSEEHGAVAIASNVRSSAA